MTKVTGFLLHRILHNQVITYERTIVDNPTIINNKTFTHTLFTLVIIEPIENITAKYNNNQKLSISTTVAENPKLPLIVLLNNLINLIINLQLINKLLYWPYLNNFLLS